MDTQTSPTYVDGPVTQAQLEAGAWARAEHVAIALGVDERTIRRRVNAGAIERGHFAGRVYVRQAPRPAVQAAPDSAGQPASALSTSTSAQLEAAFGVALREHTARVEHLATELGHARANLEQLERVRQLETEAQLANRRALELELANVRQVVTSTEAQLATVRQAAELSTARAARLEALARAPWYAVRVRRRIRRELASA